ncbi:arginine deiminase [Saccharicrinis fermentans]|uniref:arginine deiminase n=1 Tax=Saccharicrinis fermentans DSM 9555 = JCM 21142 TaxID=869213 RepID=W7Y1U0_9BACT|nr:arginine deiminase family protein [Saccharicrinis fermentans]GAF01488.1 arginine deiminase [Saccharicrinis fermentans DSM 9555 = JCM 21142]
MAEAIHTGVYSEIGEIEGVILHTPGSEVENMTPGNAERALYSDILNLSVAEEEYRQLSQVLEKITHTFQVKDLLTEILNIDEVREALVHKICKRENAKLLKEKLLALKPSELARQIIEGVPLHKNTLTSFLSDERNALRPLHNFFFTRDASMTVYDKVLIGKMATKVREREALVMETIFNHSSKLKSNTVNPSKSKHHKHEISIEGGDILVAREDILIVGTGVRTSTQGVDYIIRQLQKNKGKHSVVVQQLPSTPESFIHLDMVFTLLDRDMCMVYDPIIMQPNKYQTILISIEDGHVKNIEKQTNLVQCLNGLGMPLKPLYCGGRKDLWIQEREQWHSGANFFAVGPGKVIGYDRNVYTMEEMNNNGFEIIPALDVIDNKISLNDYEKYVITISGSELARGGGGARCMTMPFKRKRVDY